MPEKDLFAVSNEIIALNANNKELRLLLFKLAEAVSIMPEFLLVQMVGGYKERSKFNKLIDEIREQTRAG